MSLKHVRKQFLILPSYQIKLVGFLVGLLFVGSILHGFLLYLLTSRNVQEGFLSAHNRFRSTWEILKPAIVLTNGISFLVLSLLLMTFSILISHRLIGPIFKVANRLKELASGKLHNPPLKLRRGDEGKILCEAVNQFHLSWSDRLAGLNVLKQRFRNGSPPPAEEVQKALEEALKDVEFSPPDQ